MRVEDYGPGAIRPHERTHPGPKADRLSLTRATRANLSPIFSLYSDPAAARVERAEAGDAGRRAVRRVRRRPTARATASGGSPTPTRSRPSSSATSDAELLIADGHHRYETARVYADEIGGEGAHRYVLMCLVALQDEGLTVFPTHRLVDGLKGTDKPELLATTLRACFDIEEIAVEDLVPPTTTPARSAWATWTASSSARSA